RLPVLRLLDGVTAGAHGDEARQVLVLAAQAVRDPRPQAWPDQPRFAAVHQHQRRLVVWYVGLHGADDSDGVDAGGHVWEQVADLDAALPILAELERRRQRRPGLPLGREVGLGQLLPRVLEQGWLGVKGIDV